MINFLETGRIRNFLHRDVYTNPWRALPDSTSCARLYVGLFAAGIKYGIPDLAEAASHNLHYLSIDVDYPNHIPGHGIGNQVPLFVWDPVAKVVLEDMYELEEKYGPPITRLRQRFIRCRGSDITQLRKPCSRAVAAKAVNIGSVRTSSWTSAFAFRSFTAIYTKFWCKTSRIGKKLSRITRKNGLSDI